MSRSLGLAGFACLLGPLLAADAGENTKLLAPGGSPGDYFGKSVAAEGDLIVVGAPFDDENGDNAGAAIVYRRTGDAWAMEARLTSGETASGDHFGAAVATDGERILVGSPEDDDRGENAGAAFVFSRVEGVWTIEAKLLPPVAGHDRLFGAGVALSGARALVGVSGNSSDDKNFGTAHVFVHQDGAWSHEAKLSIFSHGGKDAFNASVAMQGDLAVIGAPFDRVGKLRAGAAYVFKRSGGGWGFAARLVPADPTSRGRFGAAVSVDEGVGRVLIGAPGANAAYAFRGRDNQWSQEAKLTIEEDRAYGAAVALRGANALVAAGDLDGAVDRYCVASWDAGPTPVVADDQAAFDWFGRSLALGGGFIVAGSPRDDDNGSLSGSATVIALDGGCPCPGDVTGDGQTGLDDLSIVLNNLGMSGASFADGDLNGDGTVALDDVAGVLGEFGGACR